MKKLYILLIACLTFITLPGLHTEGASYTGNDIAITELNGLTLNEVYRDGNLITNPNFSNGTNGWTPNRSTHSVTNQILNNVGDGTFVNPGSFTTSISYTTNTLYSIFKGRVLQVASRIQFNFRGSSTAGTISNFQIISPDPNQWGTRIGGAHVMRPEEVVYA